MGASASTSVLPMNIQDWFPLGWAGLILQSKGLSRVFSNTTVQKYQFFSAHLIYEPTLILFCKPTLWPDQHKETGNTALRATLGSASPSGVFSPMPLTSSLGVSAMWSQRGPELSGSAVA